MLRTIVGFAVLAVVGFFVLKLVFALLGFAFGAAIMLLQLALVGLVIYWVLKLIAPSTARKVCEMISGQPPLE